MWSISTEPSVVQALPAAPLTDLFSMVFRRVVCPQVLSNPEFLAEGTAIKDLQVRRSPRAIFSPQPPSSSSCFQ